MPTACRRVPDPEPAAGNTPRTSPHLQFLLRTVYAPPEAVRSAVQAGYLAMLDRLETHFREQLAATTYRGDRPGCHQ